MDKKLTSKITGTNVSFFIMSMFATLTFMMHVESALYMITDGKGTLNSIGYTLFQMKISVTRDTYTQIYNIDNYPLIPIFAGVIYNIYIRVKSYRNRNIVNS